MRGVSAFVAAVALAIVPALPAAAASDETGGERITSYDVQLAVQTDGSMRVRETIGYDFGGDVRHRPRLPVDHPTVHTRLAAGRPARTGRLAPAGGADRAAGGLRRRPGHHAGATSPVSSSSGGGSGFSGGSAGGGGGGGGGGSW
jgi:hypothetical protein